MLRASNVPGRIWVQFRIEDDYMEKEIDLRRLVIKAFHITEVEEGGENKVTASGKMTIEKKILDEILPKYPQLSKLDVQIIRPGEHDRYTNTMMDIIPISTKVLGKIGDGITHTLTGVYVILTGVDETTVAALPYHFRLPWQIRWQSLYSGLKSAIAFFVSLFGNGDVTVHKSDFGETFFVCNISKLRIIQ